MPDLFDVRKNFLDNPFTIQKFQRDFHEWHLGRMRYALWAVDVDCPAVQQQVQAAQQHLAGLLLEGYCRQPHVTLGISGFVSDMTQYADDYCAGDMNADLTALHHAAIQPFEIEVGTLSSFSSAPFFHVHDSANNLSLLHKLLHSTSQDERIAYVPHVTVGLYAGAWPTEMVGSHLDIFPQHHVTRCQVKRISLMTYDANEIGGRLVTVADYDLGKSEIHWHEPLPFGLSGMAEFSQRSA